MSRKKIALIGGGQIGGNLALLCTQKELGDVIIFDIPNAEGMVKGKALDIMQLRPHDGYDANISGTSDWNDVKNADVFIGLSVGNTVSKKMLKTMKKDPLVFALSNPDPEIAYNLAMKTRSDIIMATGRSDLGWRSG